MAGPPLCLHQPFIFCCQPRDFSLLWQLLHSNVAENVTNTKTRKVYKKVTTKQPLLLQNIYSIAFKIIHEIVENQAGSLQRFVKGRPVMIVLRDRCASTCCSSVCTTEIRAPAFSECKDRAVRAF